MIKSKIGKIRKTARCCASSTVCAFAEPRTVIVIAIKDIAGDANNRMTSQLILGKNMVPINTSISTCVTISIAKNEVKETIILNRNAAAIFDWKIFFSGRGQ